MQPANETISFLAIVLAFVIVAVTGAAVSYRRKRAARRGIAEADALPFRQIDAYAVVPRLVGQAIEADRPVLFSTGSASLGDQSTVITLAGAALMYYITQRVAISETPPLFLTSETSVVPFGYDVLRRAYLSRGTPVRSGIQSVRWFPSGPTGERSLVFAAMLTATMHSDDVAGSVFVGRFGEELALALLSSQRRSVPSIAGSSDIIGQAVAYAMADGALIGEDIFSPVGYLGEKSSEKGSLAAQDVLRVLVILTILLIAVYQLAGEQLGSLVAPLLNPLGG